MSVLDIPLDAEPDELLLARSIGRGSGTHGKRRTVAPRHTTNHWGVGGTHTIPSITADDLYDEANGPRRGTRYQTHEWNDHQVEELVLRLAAADQAAANVEQNTLVRNCKRCDAPSRTTYCSDECKRLHYNRKSIERIRERKAEAMLVAAFGI